MTNRLVMSTVNLFFVIRAICRLLSETSYCFRFLDIELFFTEIPQRKSTLQIIRHPLQVCDGVNVLHVHVVRHVQADGGVV